MLKRVDGRVGMHPTFEGLLRSAVSRLKGAPRWLAIDLRERLIHVEEKIDDVLSGELRARLVRVDDKVSGELLARLVHVEENLDDVRLGRLADVADKLDDLRSGAFRRRLIRIEQKLDGLCRDGSPSASPVKGSCVSPADPSSGQLTYARFGEDLCVVEIFASLGIDRPHYLDAGAHHPSSGSNTALLYARGSRGVNVEAHPGRVEAFRQLRPEDVALNCGVGPVAGEMIFCRMDGCPGSSIVDREMADALVRAHPDARIADTIPVRIRTLDDIVSTELGGRWPDLLNLGAEGSSLDILASADFRDAGPLVIIVKVGGSDPDAPEQLRERLASLGYAIACRTPGSIVAARTDAGAAPQPALDAARQAVPPPAAKLDLAWAERSATRGPDGRVGKAAMARIASRASYTVRMSLSRRSIVSDLFSYAHHAPALPDHQVLQGLYTRMVRASRAGDLHALYREVLTCAKADRLIAVPVDMTNTQLSGAALYDRPFATGYEPEILALLDLFLPKDGVLYDIGSNWGYFTFHALLDPAFRGRVVAMEPVARSFADLVNVATALEVQDRLVALHFAAGEAESTLPISDDAASGNQSLVGTRAGGEMVKVVAIDDLDVPPPSLLKLDVEGFELFAMRGMRSTIARTRAPIVFESWYDPASPDVSLEPMLLLTELGYHLYVPDFAPASEPRADVPFEVAGELGLTDLTASTRADHPVRINIFASAARLF